MAMIAPGVLAFLFILVDASEKEEQYDVWIIIICLYLSGKSSDEDQHQLKMFRLAGIIGKHYYL